MDRYVLNNVPLLRLLAMLRKRKLAYFKQVCYDRCINNSSVPPGILLFERKNHTTAHLNQKRKENTRGEAPQTDKE